MLFFIYMFKQGMMFDHMIGVYDAQTDKISGTAQDIANILNRAGWTRLRDDTPYVKHAKTLYENFRDCRPLLYSHLCIN